eukprot:350682-Chlamydomonas_euryale.AAC.4
MSRALVPTILRLRSARRPFQARAVASKRLALRAASLFWLRGESCGGSTSPPPSGPDAPGRERHHTMMRLLGNAVGACSARRGLPSPALRTSPAPAALQAPSHRHTRAHHIARLVASRTHWDGGSSSSRSITPGTGPYRTAETKPTLA